MTRKMTMSSSALLHNRLTQRVCGVVAAGAALALIAVAAWAPGTAVQAALPDAVPAAAPAAAPEAVAGNASAGQTDGAPGVVHFDAAKLEPTDRLDRRTMRTGLTVKDGYMIVWGFGDDGLSGGYPEDEENDNEEKEDVYPPTAVYGLPQGAIVDAAAGRNDLNAIDTEGCVWGWGLYGHRTGTGQTSTGSGAKKTYSTPPRKVKKGMRWDEGGKADELCGMQTITRTVEAGAGIDEFGQVWSWGASTAGGVNPDWPGGSSVLKAGNYPGAHLVEDLPWRTSTDPGNRPVQIEGGYATFWVLLANGDVWYFGNGTNTNVFSAHYERLDQPEDYSGWVYDSKGKIKNAPKPDMQRENIKYNSKDGTVKSDDREPVRAARANSLAPWFRSANNPDGYIVQMHSGWHFGAALLSTGKVLTWGEDKTKAALGRVCKDKPCARTPAFLDFSSFKNGNTPIYGASPRFVGLSCGFYACYGITENGDLWGWGRQDALAFEGRDELNDEPIPSKVASNVRQFQAGMGYIIWWTMDGYNMGRGYNSRGMIGTLAGNYGVKNHSTETKARNIWFGNNGQRQCSKTYNQQRPPVDADGIWDKKKDQKPPSGWVENTKEKFWYNATGNIVYRDGEYTNDKWILYESSNDKDRKTCHLLNTPANRRSLDTCIDSAIAAAKKGIAAGKESWASGCA
jgi:alpha-tubulin suppressor-like RCC1 family protein